MFSYKRNFSLLHIKFDAENNEKQCYKILTDILSSSFYASWVIIMSLNMSLLCPI